MAVVKSGVLTPSTAAAVTVDAAREVLVTNISQSGAIWVNTTGGTATVRGDDCYAVLGQRIIRKKGTVTLSLIADQAIEYSVEGVPA